jgi:steroid delta-isomerase-like uncharacterized protein
MSDSPSVAAVRAAAAAFTRGDVDGYFRDFDTECVRWIIGFESGLGLDDVRGPLVEMFGAFHDLELSAEALFGQDETVCARWRIRGTHTADFLGVPASGREVDVRTCEIYQFSEGMIREVWVYGDPLGMLRQIEAAPVKGPVA